MKNNRVLRAVLAALVGAVLTLVFSSCAPVEDSFVLDIPANGDVEVIPANVSLTCWYSSSGTMSPMDIDLIVNRVSRRVTVVVSSISRVTRTEGLTVVCASQYVPVSGGYRLPGPKLGAGFVSIGVYFSGANYQISFTEHRYNGSTGTGEFQLIPWVGNMLYGRSQPRPVPTPMMM